MEILNHDSAAVCANLQVELPDGGRPCNLGIWDTAGQERFDSLSRSAFTLFLAGRHRLTPLTPRPLLNSDVMAP